MDIPAHLTKYDWYELHKKWLTREGGGVRADLRNANLRYANLRNANLRYANLRNAVGCHVLTHTQHGYTVLAVWCLREDTAHWRIRAGCRDYTIADARKHWNPATYTYQPDAERITLMLDWLEKQPAPEEA